MKIAHINMLHNGSTGRIMFQISKAAEMQGHTSRTYTPMIYARGKKIESPNLSNHYVWGTKVGNFIHYYIGTLLGLNGMMSVKGTQQLISNLDSFKPDIIHLHNLHNFTINLPMLFSYIKKSNVKVVWTLHDCWAFTGHCPYFDMVKCEKWKTECYKCPQKKMYPKMYFDTSRFMYRLKKKMFSNIDNLTIVTPSQWLAELVNCSFLSMYPTRVIHNGVDLSLFSPKKNQVKEQYKCEDKHLILGVAFDWDRRKGVDVFIEMAKKLGECYQIMLVGTNDYVDSILPPNIISIHRTESEQELAKLYTAADVFVNPTREDNYPTVNMEALACGTPVVTFQTGGSPEIIDETCGLAIDCDNIGEMMVAIRKVCEDEIFKFDDCIQRSKSCDMHQKFNEYIDLYEKMHAEEI